MLEVERGDFNSLMLNSTACATRPKVVAKENVTLFSDELILLGKIGVFHTCKQMLLEYKSIIHKIEEFDWIIIHPIKKGYTKNNFDIIEYL